MSATLEMVEIRAKKLFEADPSNMEIVYMLSDISLVRSQLERLRDRAKAGTIRLNDGASPSCNKCGCNGSGKIAEGICGECISLV
jgi:hypothetical protein